MPILKEFIEEKIPELSKIHLDAEFAEKNPNNVISGRYKLTDLGKRVLEEYLAD